MPPQPSAWRLKPIHLQEKLIDLTDETIHLSADTIDLSDDTIDLSEEEATHMTREGNTLQKVATVKETINRVDVESEVVDLQSEHVDESVVEVHTAEPSGAHLQEPTREIIVECGVKVPAAEVPAHTAETTPAVHRDEPVGAGAGDDVVEHGPAPAPDAATHVQEPLVLRQAPAPPKRRRRAPAAPLLACSECARAFKCHIGLEQHMKTHSREEPFACDRCDWRYAKLNDLKRHYGTHSRTHSRAKWKTFYKKLTQLGIATNEGVATHRCTGGTCDLSFSEQSDLKTHEEMHSLVHGEEKPYPCKMCDERFSEQNGLMEHERLHTEPRPERVLVRGARGAAPPTDHHACEDRPHACSMCGKRFKQRKHMTNHERLHCNNTKPFPCATCDKRFNDTERLRRHERTHTDPPPPAGPLVCTKCNHEFQNNYQLKRHERDRICEREHACGSCSAVFARRSALMMHVCRWHAPAQPYHRCDVCRRPFLRLRSLLKHGRTHHLKRPYPYKCALCTRAFAALASLENHMERAHEQHSYQCNICQTNFADSVTLEKHVLLEECDSNTDAGERAHYCGICNAGFDCFDLFQNHARIHM